MNFVSKLPGVRTSQPPRNREPEHGHEGEPERARQPGGRTYSLHGYSTTIVMFMLPWFAPQK